jgi:hypothetical protein
MATGPVSPQMYYLPEGAEVYIGRPRTPLPDEKVKAIERLARALPSLREAHLPQLYVPGVTPKPGQVLVIGTDAEPAELAAAVARFQTQVVQETGQTLDVLPLSKESPLWTDIRNQRLGLALA